MKYVHTHTFCIDTSLKLCNCQSKTMTHISSSVPYIGGICLIFAVNQHITLHKQKGSRKNRCKYPALTH